MPLSPGDEDEVALFRGAVDDHGENLADQRAIDLPRDRPLQLHGEVPPLGFDLLGNLAGHLCRWRPLLLRVSEDADVVKTDLPQELEELLEVGVALSRVADDKRAAQRDVGDLGADPLDQPVDVRPVRLCAASLLSTRSEACWSGSSMYLQSLGSAAITSRIASLRCVG